MKTLHLDLAFALEPFDDVDAVFALEPPPRPKWAQSASEAEFMEFAIARPARSVSTIGHVLASILGKRRASSRVMFIDLAAHRMASPKYMDRATKLEIPSTERALAARRAAICAFDVRVLLVTEDVTLADDTCKGLDGEAKVFIASTVQQALSLAETAIDLVVCDAALPGAESVHLHQWLAARRADLLRCFHALIDDRCPESTRAYFRDVGAHCLVGPALPELLRVVDAVRDAR